MALEETPAAAPAPENFERAFTTAAAAAASAQSAGAPPPAEPTPAAPAAPVTPPTPAAPPPTPPVLAAPSALAQAAQRAGLAIDGLTDDQLAAAMADTIVRTRPYASYGQQMAPYADQIREYFERQTPPAAATPGKPEAAAAETAWDPDKYFTEKWPAPKWDETYNFAIQNGMVQRNAETGMYEPAPGYEQIVLELLPGLNRATTWTAQQWQGITRGNPYQQFYEVLQEPLRHAWQDDIRQIVQEQFQQQQTEQRVNRFEADNSSWLYAVDPQSGTQVLTPKGQTFYNEIAQLRERGITDPQTLIDLASRLVGVGSTPAGAPAPTTGAPPVPPGPPNPQAASAEQTTTFLQNALERAAHAPSAGGYTQIAPDHPVTVNETDLNSMFVSAYREAQGGKI